MPQLFFHFLFTQSKKLNLDMNVPNSDMAPHAAHITKLRPIDPVLISSPVGETNIPEPVQDEHIAINMINGVFQ